MSGFPPPPNQQQRFPPPPGASNFPPPPPAGGSAPSLQNQQGGFPPPPGQPMAPLNSAMGNMSLQQPQQQRAPFPGAASPAPAAHSMPRAPGAPPGPQAGAAPTMFTPPPPGGQPVAPGPMIFQPPPPGASAGGPPPPGPQVSQPVPPAPGASAGGATGWLSHQNQSKFYHPTPSQPQMDRIAAPAGPGAMPAAPAPTFNENTDFSIKIPERIFRLTAGKLAQSAAQANSSRIPFGALLRPLAPEAPDEEAVDTVQPGNAGIVRCKRCRTYINAFVAWSEHGRRWRCNICGQMNECPSAYFCHLDEQGLRRDRFERPELSKGIIEYIAPAEYMVRPPQEPSYFFVIDVSATAVRSGVLQSAAQAIKASLDDLPGRGRTKIGFITFDNSVHYYNLASDLASPQMLVVSDLKQLFVPLPDNLLVNLQDSRAVVESFLDNLPEMFTKNPVVSQSCLGSALKAAFTVMKEVGGKMCIFQSIMPNMGDGILKPREQPGIMGTPNEVKLLRHEVSWYKDTAIEFSRQQISVDMFLFPYQYMDLAALGELPRYSAGSLHSFPSFNYEKDGQRFQERLIKCLVQKTAFEAVMRIRCTKGMKITNFYGNFYIRGQDLMALPNCNAESVFGFDLAHDEQNIANKYVTVQAALLYTSSDGERRIRVMTQALPVSASSSDIVASVDTDACCALLAKQALEVAIKTSLDNARMRLQQICVEMLRASKGGDKRTVSGYTVPPEQNGGAQQPKETPDNLKLLPLYTLALMKNVAFRGGIDVHPDERIMSHYLLNRMFVIDSKHYIYPRLFSIHDMGESAGRPAEGSLDKKKSYAGRNNILLPPLVNLSVDRLTSDGVFLLDNGVEMYLWVGRTAEMNMIGSLFGVHSLDDVDPNQVKIQMSGDSFASRFGAIVQALREDEADPFVVSSKINVVREGDQFMEGRFFWFMVEDRASFQGGSHSYEEFMEFVNNPNASSGGPPGPSGGPPGARGGPPGPPGGPRGMPSGPQGKPGMQPAPPQQPGMGMAPHPPRQPGPPAPPGPGMGIPQQGGMPPPPGRMGAAPSIPPPQSAPPAMGRGGPPPPGGHYGAPPGPPPGQQHQAPHSGGFGGPPPQGPPSGGFHASPPHSAPSRGPPGGMPPPPGRAVQTSAAPPPQAPRHAMPPPPPRGRNPPPPPPPPGR